MNLFTLSLSTKIKTAINSIEFNNIESQKFILRTSLWFKNGIIDGSDTETIKRYFNDYSTDELKLFFKNPKSLNKEKSINILKDYCKCYEERQDWLKTQKDWAKPSANTQMGIYENIGTLIYLASSSSIIMDSLFEEGLKMWKLLIPAINEEGLGVEFSFDDIPDIFLDYIKS